MMKPIFFSKSVLVTTLVLLFALIAFHAYADQDPDTVKPKVLEVHLPKYFTPIQWNTDGWVMGVMSDKFLKFHPETGAWKVLQSNVWSGIADPSSRFLAFRNAKGLHYVDLGNEGTSVLIDKYPEIKLHFWSPDSRYVLYSHQGEWVSKYFLYDRVSNQTRPYQFANVENFLSEPIAWRSFRGKDQILFLLRFSRSKTGENALRSNGYRAEFYLGDLNGEFTPVVQVEDGQFPVFDTLNWDATRLYYHFYSKKEQVWEVDLQTGQQELRWTIPNAKRFSLAGGRGLALVNGDILELVSLKKYLALYSFSFEYNSIIWSPDYTQALLLPSYDSKEQKGFLIELQR